jgi:hypothetical protein
MNGNRGLARLIVLLVFMAFGCNAMAQDLEPRRWTHMPSGLNVLGLGTTYTKGDIYFDPVLELEDVKVELASAGLVYLRTFGLFGKSARIDALAPYGHGRWDGLLQGEPASTRRSGFSDPRLRLSVLLYGGPAMDKKEFVESPRSNTVVGAAVSVKIPWGEYYPDKLINLGANRWMIRPQLGVTHTRNKWTYELTGSLFWYEDNDNFWGGNVLENDVLYAIQGHVIYTFKPGLWASFSTAYGDGQDAFVNGVRKDLVVENWMTAVSFGFPINRQQGIKLSWLRSRTQNNTGSDLDSLVVGWTYVF